MFISNLLMIRTAIVVNQAVLMIRSGKLGKLGKTRLVPLHPSTFRELAAYLSRCEACFDRLISPFMFVSRYSNRIDQGTVHRTFYALSRSTGLRGLDASHGPRLHDFRHRFAVRVLTRWYQTGEDAARRLPVLSAYLGHVRVADTYWYLSAWPELIVEAMSRLETRWGESS